MAGEASERRGSLAAALALAERLLPARPDLAEAQAREILRLAPQLPEALRLLGAARRLIGDATGATDILRPLAREQGDTGTLFELGAALADCGKGPEAIAALKRVVRLDPAHWRAWLALADQLMLAGDARGAEEAYAQHIRASVNNPELLKAAAALCANKLAIAEHTLRPYLKENPTDVAAIRMMAEVAARLARYEDAEKLLARALELAPGFDAARHNYATVLYRQGKAAESLAQIEILLKTEPRNPAYRTLHAAGLAQIGEYERAIVCYEGVLQEFPQQPKSWMSYGHALKTVGRTEDAVAAYRKSIALLPSLGEPYWSLANLKTFQFGDEDIAAMEMQLARTDLDNDDRLHFHFALGKALEDRGAFAESFGQYEKGNSIRLARAPYDREELSEYVRRCKALLTPGFFAERRGTGCRASDPIFIVGLPRAGSTLVEQILSSHSAVEATMELPDLIAIAKRLGGKRGRQEASAYPESLATLDAGALKSLGEEFLARTRIQRKSGRPRFIDKMPNNFRHVGLIQLILPNAKIIDVRRHPLACCFSNFKQHFARGQNFTYSQEDVGRYYVDYAMLMAHFDSVLPGRVHRVLYERLVANPEAEIRRLLEYCGLTFEDRCLRFYENARPVRTASSEQVRRPLFADAVDHWRNFEPWLEPLKAALGPALDNYCSDPPTPQRGA